MKFTERRKLARRRRFLDFLRPDGGRRRSLRRILILRNGLLGDVVFITPLIRSLGTLFPHASLDLVVSERASEMMKQCPFVRSVDFLPDGASLFRQIRFFASLRRRQYDLAVILESNSHYSIMSVLLGARFVVGFENTLDILLDYAVPWRNELHAVLAEMEALRGWADDDDQPALSPPATELAVSEEEMQEAGALLGPQGGVGTDRRPAEEPRMIVCIHPGCNEPDSPRQWLTRRYSELADRLVETCGASIVFTGVGKDRPEVEAIRRGMRHDALDLCGKTPIRLFMAVLKHARAVVGPDTGALHIAVALGTPVVMLMGYTDPNDTGPFDPSGRSRIVRAGLPCSPCMPRDPKPLQWETCRQTRPVLCMDLLATDRVVREVSGLIGAHPAPAPPAAGGVRA